MPQMVSIQPVVPQGPPPGAPGPKEHSPFSPHLENALASKKSQQQAGQSKSDKKTSPVNDQKATNDEAVQSLAAADSEAIETVTGEYPQDGIQLNNAIDTVATEFRQDGIQLKNAIDTDTVATEFRQDGIQLKNAIDTVATEFRQDGIQLKNASTSLANFLEGTTRTIPPISIFSRLQQLASTANMPQDSSAIIGSLSNNPEMPAGFSTLQAGLSLVSTESEILNVTKPGVTNRQDALLNQLQQIIENANEIGTVSITKAANVSPSDSSRNNIHGLTTALFAPHAEPVTASPAAATVDLTFNGLLIAGAEGIEKTAGKPTQNWTGIRHDIQQQYFNARNTMQNLADNNQNFQNNQQGEEFSEQSMSSGPQSSIFTATESTNTFSQISATLQPGTAQPVSESPKPILLPSGVIVQEDDVIRQLNERFQITSRHMDSRINIKLHPAELGELKIDLTVKEGSIRANVVAQSQQALEILERNIQKLRNALEQQGFTIDEISLTAESESVGDFDLFDQQLFGKNDYTPTRTKNRLEGEATFSLEDHEIAAPVSNTGVNVKI